MVERCIARCSGFGDQSRAVVSGLEADYVGFSLEPDVTRLVKEISDQKLKIRAACAGRTVVADIRPMVEISQATGVPIEVYTFIGSSPIRQYAEEWDIDSMLRRSEEAIEVEWIVRCTNRCVPALHIGPLGRKERRVR